MRIIEILKILQKYNIDDSYPCWAEHDIIGFYINHKEISKEDLAILDKLGCFYSEEYESLIMFV